MNISKEVYCPVCKKNIQSYHPYLAKVFDEDSFAYYSAILVTHYRHDHTSYDKSVSYVARFHNIDKNRIKYNNRAKRQLIRAFFKDNSLSKNFKLQQIQGFLKLKNNDSKTFEVISNFLSKLVTKEITAYV
jgi:hypothetical protein